jgi:hypothetical protein
VTHTVGREIPKLVIVLGATGPNTTAAVRDVVFAIGSEVDR